VRKEQSEKKDEQVASFVILLQASNIHLNAASSLLAILSCVRDRKRENELIFIELRITILVVFLYRKKRKLKETNEESNVHVYEK